MAVSYYCWRKPEDPEKTIVLSQVTDKLYHKMLYSLRFELTTSVVICTDNIGSRKSNYHTSTWPTFKAEMTWNSNSCMCATKVISGLLYITFFSFFRQRCNGFAMSLWTSLSHRSENARHCWPSLANIIVARIIASCRNRVEIILTFWRYRYRRWLIAIWNHKKMFSKSLSNTN